MPRTPLLFARLRLRWHRRAVTQWAVTVICAGLCGFLLAPPGRSRAPAGRHSTTTRPVVVATAPVGPGEALDAKVAVEERPVAGLPNGTLASMPAGRVALVALYPREIVIADRISDSPGQGPAALIPPGSRGVTVATGDAAPSLRIGDRVDLVVTAEGMGEAATPTTPSPLGADGDGPSSTTRPSSPSSESTIASGVPVVDTRPDAITVAVPADRVPAVARAVSNGTVVVVLSGPTATG